MEKEKVRRITAVYTDALECYQRTIRAIMALGNEKTHLMPKEVEILSAMCLAVSRGENINDHRLVRKLMVDNGLSHVSAGTFRNYKSTIKKAGWLVPSERGYALNMYLAKAVEHGGMSIGVFLNDKP